MKKNITINLFGELYAIDEDAYELLDNYLNSMKRYFSRQTDGDEITDDIEHRVAELLWEKRKAGMSAVNIETVRGIIATIGNPQDIGSEGSGASPTGGYNKQERSDSAGGEWSERVKDFGRQAEQAFTNVTDDVKKRTRGRKLYRDPEQRMLGGVCAGLATYFGDADIMLVRIITLVSIFLPVPTLIVYLVLWIVVPEARTTEDRLRMQGIDVTPENLNEELLRSGLKSGEQGEKPRRSGCLWALIIVIALPVLAIAMLWLSVFLQFLKIIPEMIF